MVHQVNSCAWKTHDSEAGHAQQPALSLPRRAAALALIGTALAGAPVASRGATLADSANRKVEVGADVAHVVPAGVPAQILLHALAPGKLCGLVEPFKPEHAIYVDPAVVRLPQLPLLTRTDAPGDLAAVAACKPNLVVDYGNVSARYAAADAKIQNELKVPTVLFGGGLGDVGGVARALGSAMGLGPRGEEIAGTARDVLGRVKAVADLPDADRVPVYLARGKDGLDAARAGTSFDEPIRLAGGRNVVSGTGGTFRRMKVADVVALKPAVVIVDDEGALHGTLRAALPKGTRFVLDAGEPYKVLTGAPSINRLAGVLALAAILHPDKVKPDPEAAARVEAGLFALPPGVADPSPLQVRD